MATSQILSVSNSLESVGILITSTKKNLEIASFPEKRNHGFSTHLFKMRIDKPCNSMNGSYFLQGISHPSSK